jgi:prepilin-type N-terminal cleavage/methylation domain-containing protein
MKIKTHTARPGQRGLDYSHQPAPAALWSTAFKFRSAAGTRGASASGFTLIETIVATLIAAIMLPASYACFGAGFSMMQGTRENLRATQVIVQRMEAIRLASYSNVQNPAAFPTNVTEYYNPSGQATGSGGIAYTVTYDCAPVPNVNGGVPINYRTNMVMITVTAAWNSGKVQHSTSMQSYVAKYGVQRYVTAY